ncbi:molybdopterin-dependent oxidoreductase, partial [Desulfobulbus sp. F4]|nr:molybdopterin-dependent oxidoreductase [Desulfobulbus sp. F4]
VVLGEDPAIADANIGHVHQALKELELLIVQDIFLTDTAKEADVVLPAACFAEKDGTFTCTERRVQRVRKAVEPPGQAKPDWLIFIELASRMGYDMGCASPEDVFKEVCELLPQYRGLSYARLEKEGLQWPVPDADHPGTPVLHIKTFTRGKGLFVPEDYLAPKEPTDAEYPLLFTTGRHYARYNFSSMTGKTVEIDDIAPECLAEVNPADAERLGMKEGDMLRLTSRRGSVLIRGTITERSQQGTIFTTYNYADTPVNYLTLDALDRLSRTPEYKLCAIKAEVVRGQ